MDQELITQFQEKNLEILRNKLKLDVSNNMDALTLSLNQLLDFEVSNAQTKILNIFLDVDAKMKDGEQTKILIAIGEKYLDETKNYLKAKRKELMQLINQITSEEKFNFYESTLQRTETEFSDYLKNTLISYVDQEAVSSVKKLSRKTVSKVHQDFVNQRTVNYLKEHFVRRLADKTIEQLQIRNQTLINNAYDTYQHYMQLPNV